MEKIVWNVESSLALKQENIIGKYKFCYLKQNLNM